MEILQRFLVCCLLSGISLAFAKQNLIIFVPVKKDFPGVAPYVRIVDRLTTRMGYAANLVDDLPTARARLDLISGRLDGVLGMSDANIAEFGSQASAMTIPLFESRIDVFSREPFVYRNLESLKGHTVGTRRIDAPAGILSNRPGIILYAANDEASAIRMLFAGRTELLILNRIIFQAGLLQLEKREIIPYYTSEEPFLRPKNFLVLSNKFREKIPQFDAMLRQMIADGEYEKLLKGKL